MAKTFRDVAKQMACLDSVSRFSIRPTATLPHRDPELDLAMKQRQAGKPSHTPEFGHNILSCPLGDWQVMTQTPTNLSFHITPQMDFKWIQAPWKPAKKQSESSIFKVFLLAP